MATGEGDAWVWWVLAGLLALVLVAWRVWPKRVLWVVAAAVLAAVLLLWVVWPG